MLENNKKIEDLAEQKNETAALAAALKDAYFECQKLELLNYNLEIQLNETRSELSANIKTLQSVADENKRLQQRVAKLEAQSQQFENVNDKFTAIVSNAQAYTKTLALPAKRRRAGDDDFVAKINDLLNNMTQQLDTASAILFDETK